MESDSIIKKLRIVKIIPEATEAKTFVLEAVGWQPQYKAGQFITLVFFTERGEKRRSYSISSAPELNEQLSITVKKVDNGEFSRMLVYYAKEGDILYSSGVSGFFVLPEVVRAEQQLFFLAAGSGITPCFALMKTALAASSCRVVLFYSNKDMSSAIFYEEIKALQEKYGGRLSIRFLFSDSNSVYYKRMSKWLLEQLLEEYLMVDMNDALFYLCGPFDYMQTIELTLPATTYRKNIFKENFSSLPRYRMPRPPDVDMHIARIHINGQVHEVEVQYPKSILAAAKSKNIELPYSCEAGRCGSCVATCSSGKIWMAYNEVLTDKEVANGRVLVCQSFPVGGNVAVEF